MLALSNSPVSLASAAHPRKNIFMLYNVYILLCKTLSNKQSTKVICRFDRFRKEHSKSQKVIWVTEILLAAHAFGYMVVWTIISACNAS